ncbi:amino acid ABC transporter permease [Devosia sp.]|uniref:amino acid ABC transporter permease n=1 Tax=Devosia sp. TaxID=1871048 RepID=UPI0019E82497|nr:amino acid ABC transporter permease [Devosia sp.]MBE0578776.1 amino acid ABC transporter permease [Devosia sp.]
MLLLEYSGFLLAGFLTTLRLSLAVVLGATFCAILFAVGLSIRSPLVRRPFQLLVEILRDVPLIVTVFLIYFVMPRTGLALDPFWSATLAVSLWGGANGSHVIRAGLLAVPTGQLEAARAFGLSGWKGLLLIIIPQAMPVILPPYISLITAWVQSSSLGAVVGAYELFRSGQVIIEQTTISTGKSPAFLVYGFILLVYFVLCWLISRGGSWVERHFNKHRAPVKDVTRPLAGVLSPVGPLDGRT